MSADGPADLGPLPKESVALLAALVCIWVLLGVYTLRGKMKERKR